MLEKSSWLDRFEIYEVVLTELKEFESKSIKSGRHLLIQLAFQEHEGRANVMDPLDTLFYPVLLRWYIHAGVGLFTLKLKEKEFLLLLICQCRI